MKKHILLGITASIAAYKACELVNKLRKKGHEVTCVMTEKAECFITPLTLQTLSGNKVYRDMFELPVRREVAHISLADRADIIVVCPATADIIAKLAAGICDDLLTATIISSKAPVLLVPAMNERMYKNRITRANIERLKKIGYKFVEPVVGRLACGHTGIGHLADIERVVNRIEKIS